MSIITLTSDYGTKDYFVGALKGKILSQMSNATIVDLSHEVAFYNIFEASYIVESAYKNFPKNSIHIILINAEKNSTSQPVVLQLNEHFFICADNGILNMLLKNKNDQEIIKISTNNELINASFTDVFVNTAVSILKGTSLIELGTKIEKENLIEFKTFEPVFSVDTLELKGNIIYIDSFGNCITNISKNMFEEYAQGRLFEIRARNKKITKISAYFADFKVSETKNLKDFEGDALAIFNEAGNLEIAVYNGNPNSTGTAKTLLGLKFWDIITITFQS